MRFKLNRSYGMMALSFLILLVIFSCENPLIQRIVEPRTASFESNGGSIVESQTVFKDRPVRRPSDPSRSGYTFDAWYSNNETFLQEWDFAVIPNADITLYAKWNAKVLIPINDVDITLTQPVTGGVPMTSVSGASYTGTVS